MALYGKEILRSEINYFLEKVEELNAVIRAGRGPEKENYHGISPDFLARHLEIDSAELERAILAIGAAYMTLKKLPKRNTPR